MSHSGGWQCQRVRSCSLLWRGSAGPTTHSRCCFCTVMSSLLWVQGTWWGCRCTMKVQVQHMCTHLRSFCFLRILGKILTELIKSSSRLWVHSWFEDLFGTQSWCTISAYSPRIVWHAIYDSWLAHTIFASFNANLMKSAAITPLGCF